MTKAEICGNCFCLHILAFIQPARSLKEDIMEKKLLIFGKNNCPYTRAAIEMYKKQNRSFEYVDVIDDPAELNRMLGYSKGERKVPVILDGDAVIVGHEGKG